MAVSTLSFRNYISQLSGRRLGAFKAAAAKLGITFEDYIERTEAGQKCCTDCRGWKDRGEFFPDATRWDGIAAKCKACSSARGKASHEPIPIEAVKHSGPRRAIPFEDDKERSRRLINLDVRNGSRPSADSLYCAKCGHKGDDRRHEYHHHMGYSPEHVYDVVALCSSCHHEEHANAVVSQDRLPNEQIAGKAV